MLLILKEVDGFEIETPEQYEYVKQSLDPDDEKFITIDRVAAIFNSDDIEEIDEDPNEDMFADLDQATRESMKLYDRDGELVNEEVALAASELTVDHVALFNALFEEMGEIQASQEQILEG